MQIPLDYKDLLKKLNKRKAKYLVLGGYAVTYYAEPRYTKDIDIWVESSLENARKVYAALIEFGAPLAGIMPDDFTNKNLIYQIGVAPVRADIIMGIKGLNFEKAWKNRTETKLEGVKINVVGLRELIKSKEKTGRRQDERDLEDLRYVLKKGG